MGELVIKYHDFENAKKEIKRFSEQTTTDLDLKRVNNSKEVGEFLSDLIFGGGIGFDHKVTGEELNKLTSQIQTHLHSINNTQIKLIKEFGQVYSALEALDKDYIQAILISIKAAEETSEGIQKTQEQIKKIVENQRKTLEELKKFKQKLDGYVHLSDIDKIWSNCQKWHQDMASLTKEISSATEHGKDNDQKIEALKSALSATENSIKSLNESIIKINCIVHLEDVDSTWDTIQEHAEQLTEMEKQNEDIATSFQKNQEDVEAKIIETNTAIASLTQKIKYAYLIAGGAAGLAIIELILLLV